MERDKLVYVVDDDAIIRCSLAVTLRNAGYQPYPFVNGTDFLESCAYLAPGCVLLDIHMPHIDGLAVLQRVSETRTDLPILFMTADGDIPMAVGAILNGALGFIEKPFGDDVLLSTLDRIQATLPARTERSRAETQARERVDTLSHREYDVLAGLVAGLSNKAIAHRLGIGIGTIETYRANLMHKLRVRGVGSVVQLVLAAGVEPLDD